MRNRTAELDNAITLSLTPRELYLIAGWYEWAYAEEMTSPEDDELGERLVALEERRS